MISLALDISTKTIGLSIIEVVNSVIVSFHTEHFTLSATKNSLLKIIDAKDYVKSSIAKFKPDTLAIEDYSLFMKGKSSAKTITALAIMNTVIQLTILELGLAPPTMLNVNTVRAKLKTKGQPRIAKTDLPDVVSRRLGVPWTWLTDKKGKLSPANYDRADAIATNLAHLIVLGELT